MKKKHKNFMPIVNKLNMNIIIQLANQFVFPSKNDSTGVLSGVTDDGQKNDTDEADW